MLATVDDCERAADEAGGNPENGGRVSISHLK